MAQGAEHGLEGLIQAFGPVAVFLGTAFEGETAAILGGMLAHRGLAGFGLIAVIACLGAWIGDQFWFLAARHAPDLPMLRRFRAGASEGRAGALIRRNAVLATLAFRFIPGTRIAAPLLLASAGMPWGRFAALNAASCLVWGVFFTAVGWHFGLAVEHVFGRLHLLHWLLLGLVAVALIWALHHAIGHRRG